MALFFQILAHCTTVGQKKLKKSRQKISWNQINQFHEKCFDQIPFFLFQKWSKINFWTGKKFKTAKNAISRKKMISRVFFLDFFKFSGSLCTDSTFKTQLAQWALFLDLSPLSMLLKFLNKYIFSELNIGNLTWYLHVSQLKKKRCM